MLDKTRSSKCASVKTHITTSSFDTNSLQTSTTNKINEKGIEKLILTSLEADKYKTLSESLYFHKKCRMDFNFPVRKRLTPFQIYEKKKEKFHNLITEKVLLKSIEPISRNFILESNDLNKMENANFNDKHFRCKTIFTNPLLKNSLEHYRNYSYGKFPYFNRTKNSIKKPFDLDKKIKEEVKIKKRVKNDSHNKILEENIKSNPECNIFNNFLTPRKAIGIRELIFLKSKKTGKITQTHKLSKKQTLKLDLNDDFFDTQIKN